MDTVSLRNTLISYKNYGNLSKNTVNEIQDTLLNKTKASDFEKLIEKVEKEIHK